MEQRRLVAAMAGFGIPEPQIAGTIGEHGIDAKTLRKHFRRELDTGTTKANTAVAQTLYKMASSGHHAAATIFWLRCRAGWKETSVFQHTGPEGGPMEICHENLDQRITDELARLAATLDLASVPGEVQFRRKGGDELPLAGMEGAGQPTGSGR
jgi:hypothetical protein